LSVLGHFQYSLVQTLLLWGVSFIYGDTDRRPDRQTDDIEPIADQTGYNSPKIGTEKLSFGTIMVKIGYQAEPMRVLSV